METAIAAAPTVVTLSERRLRAVAAMASAIDLLRADLANYAEDRGGRFILFGSAASECLHDGSDVDLIVDFPIDAEDAAWRFAETACRDRGPTPDVRPLRFCEGRFVERVMMTATVIGKAAA